MAYRRMLILFLVICALLNEAEIVRAQDPRSLTAKRTDAPIRIDGSLNEKEWLGAALADDFVTYSPTIGEQPVNRTEVKLLYDDNALYIAARLYVREGSKIPGGLCGRDEISMNADYFHLTLTPFNDGQNLYEFIVSSANVQVDQKLITHQIENLHSGSDSHGGGAVNSESEYKEQADIEWDAVWDSEVQITENAWMLEMRIPYAAFRFLKEKNMTWGINFWRVDRNNKETSTWNPVDRAKSSKASQQGKLTDIQDINSPVRLELRPYLALYAEKYSEADKTDYLINGGLDLKYGINESYTLDMMLIPDFGQTTSDNLVLNLTAHETKYSEKRQFFTEGTELFDKAGLFYSRRIGDSPDGNDAVANSLATGETVISNPTETGIINATKISGRNGKGLGLGLFNAMTNNTYALVTDAAGKERSILTEAFANYTIAVADQSFGQYSYLNIINLNKYVPDTKYISNVSGTAFKFTDKKNKYGAYGTGAISLKNSTEENHGEYLNLNMGKLSGKIQYLYNFELISDAYDINDMGYFTLSNELNHSMILKYSMFQPKGNLQYFNTTFQSSYKSLFNPNIFTEASLRLSTTEVLKNQYKLGGELGVKPLGVKDYYEPRVAGRYYQRPSSWNISFFVVSDYRKAFTWNTRLSYKDEQGKELYFGATPGVRVNNKLSFSYSLDAWQTLDDIGYLTVINTDSIVFGSRTVTGSSQSVTGSYSFNNRTILDLKIRYYHSTVDYYSFYLLNSEGGTDPYTNYQGISDFIFNAFNIDLVYSWNFAPGSFLTVMWKNNIFTAAPIFKDMFAPMIKDFGNTIRAPQTNSVSLKISYYLDYHRIFSH